MRSRGQSSLLEFKKFVRTNFFMVVKS